jgi:uncharacterized membrane protein YedE/YeeE
MRDWQRKLGFLLLFFGFAWLCFQQFDGTMRAHLRQVGMAQHAKLSTDPAHRYSEQDVRNQIRETALAVQGHFPTVILPGTVMLVGGLLLAFGSRASKQHNAA